MPVPDFTACPTCAAPRAGREPCPACAATAEAVPGAHAASAARDLLMAGREALLPWTRGQRGCW